MAIDSSTVRAFSALFEGNSRGYGQHSKNGKKWDNWSVKGLLPTAAIEQHLAGTKGVGIVPIRADNTCVFSCIDYDIHHRTHEAVDQKQIADMVDRFELPLVVTRSKGGGAHLWIFYSEPVPAVESRRLLDKFVATLSFGRDAEVFPKQSYLRDGQLGNTINIPYYNAEGDEDTRPAYVGGEAISLKEFIVTAQSAAISHAGLKEALGGDHADAPPCLQHIIENGTTVGSRNEATYNLTIYLRQKNPKGYMDDLIDLNHAVFSRPLPIKELRSTAASAARKDYKYRCGESPCRDFCDKEACLTRRFGIKTADIPENTDIFGGLVKFNTDPVQWRLTVHGKSVYVATHTLMDYRKLMEAVADATTMVIPGMKPAEWLRELAKLMKGADEITAPSDATVGGQLTGKLAEFLRRVFVPDKNIEMDAAAKSIHREALLRGQPIAEYNDDGYLVAHFAGKDFIEFLKRNRHGDTRGATVWLELRKHGVVSGRLRSGKATITVWSVPIEKSENDYVIPLFKADF